jgi:riboflavin-specific deaminase-like protein
VTRDLLDLYLPVLPAHPGDAITVAHLGQSLDGYIATRGGESRFVTGPGNILHLHRMRALSDAVLAGAETVAIDDPRLTARLVAGDSPVRVVLDPRRRLGVDRQVFCDGAAPTLLVCAEGRRGPPARHGQAEVMAVPAADGHLDLAALIAGLHARGLRRLFVEGGGVSVSAFLAAGLLDRLQVAVAPLLIGEGRRGLGLPAPASLSACLRPPCRVFLMGEDVLFDCEPTRPRPARDPLRAPAVARVR